MSRFEWKWKSLEMSQEDKCFFSVGLPLDPLGPCRPIPWPHGTLQAYPLTPWNPVGLPLEPLGSPTHTPRPPGKLQTYPLISWDPVSLPLDPLGHCRPTPWPPRTLSPVGLSLEIKYVTINYRFLFYKYSPLPLNQVFSPDFQKQSTGYLVGSFRQ